MLKKISPVDEAIYQIDQTIRFLKDRRAELAATRGRTVRPRSKRIVVHLKHPVTGQMVEVKVR